MSKGELLIRQIANGVGSEALVHELLRELHKGYPVEELVSLLESPNLDVVKNASWIVSELGAKAKPILVETAKLLSHSSKAVRFHAIDSVLTCATPSDGGVVAKVISLLEDPEEAVRWKAMDFLSRAASSQLRAAAESLQACGTDGAILRAIALLADVENQGHEQILALLESESTVERRIGAAAAARAGSRIDSRLRLALRSADPDIRQFAESVKQLRIRSEDG